MKKAYYLSTCNTCKKILSQLNLPEDFILQDIKTNKITHEQIEEMKSLAGSYEKLFSKRAIKYKSMGLKDKKLLEEDFKQLILEEYTFLKRPIFIINNHIFIGNSAKTIEALKTHLNE